ncbi:hypothetical protein AA0114_g10034 [Alternaria tenuissima]|uniref:Uncharacterized protein n=1 Tax=Alternaria tenuissima TaxID=119927 RepID=A0A4Q4M7P4_9PLEO|nr:hypothetical protein AA0114_g10034 [Alternaria tenuissima]
MIHTNTLLIFFLRPQSYCNVFPNLLSHSTAELVVEVVRTGLRRTAPTHLKQTPTTHNNPSGAGDQTGESGGFGETPDTQGGFSDSQETEGGFGDNPDGNAQPANPNPNAPAGNDPASQNTDQHPPSARNNHNKPAASADNPFDPAAAPVPRIEVATRHDEFKQTITANGLTGKPWFFYSGLKRDDIFRFKGSLEHKLGIGYKQMPYMGNVLPTDSGGKYEMDKRKYTASGEKANEEYYWGVNSKAYAEAGEGRVYVMLPSSRSVNQPYPDQGSNLWTYEVPELTRNSRVESITVVPMKEQPDTFVTDTFQGQYVTGPEQVIWRSGDEPIGFPASELYHLQRPDEPWTTLPDVELPES